MKENISVLIVDDSAFMRKSLSIMIGSDPEITVVGTARNGQEGFDLAKSLKPDIITLDIEMPVMDGLTALKKIMTECPTSVIMVSSITTEGAQATIKAMELGAVDFIPKELSYVSVNIAAIKEDLIQKIKEIVRQKSLKDRLKRIRSSAAPGSLPKRPTNVIREIPRIGYKAIAIGISTGGPFTLQKVLPVISEKVNVPIFIVQHMPPKFTKSLAERLNGMCRLEVKEAEDNERVKPNVIYIAPGGYHMKVRSNGMSGININITSEPSDTLHRPAVDVMMNSVLDVYGKLTLGIIMTGMGKDGFEAVKNLKKLGGYSIAQDEESCVVYGMPKAIVDGGIADVVLPAEKIPEMINKVV
ncbi:MAG: chemotaxis response regulator protein-glutamate methylesterase [Ignavibacteriales bacterium]|nr:chemotaxis response regulator protein-glutamate methylesterase [Ignavibacteriales bacterium]